MNDRYEHRDAEQRWQKRWDEAASFRWTGDRTKPKFYVLEMFPYTSGRLHIGHARNYSMGDTLARLRRAQGYDVLYPMGWDAFGLPAENAARDKGVNPRAWVESNIANMRTQLKLMGLAIDWDREFATSDPVYYGRQQKLFIDLIWAPDTESDLAGYNVYRHEQDSQPVKLNLEAVKAPTFRDTEVAAGHQYSYSVSAVDVRGNESPRSEEASESVPSQ